MSDARALLRHTLATLAYRGGKAIRNAPASFGNYRGHETSRTPVEILAHIGDLLDWGLSIAAGKQEWHNSKPMAWDKECERFFAALKTFDEYLGSDKPLQVAEEKLFQGPVADIFTHIGQIAMLRRMGGAPVKGENYYVAQITTGRVGPEQAAPNREFP